MSTAALILALIVGDHTAADVVLIAFLPAAGLESIFGYCVGCKIFGLLMRVGRDPRGRSAPSALTSVAGSARPPARLELPPAELERGAAQDVVLGDLDLLEPEQLHHLGQDDHARHDRRRP